MHVGSSSGEKATTRGVGGDNNKEKKKKKEMINSFFTAGFPVITKLPWDPLLPPPFTPPPFYLYYPPAGEKKKKKKGTTEEEAMIEIPPPPSSSSSSSSNAVVVVVGERKRERVIDTTTAPPIKKKKLFRGASSSSDVLTTTTTTTTAENNEQEDKKSKISFFTGFPVITKLPWELPKTKYEQPLLQPPLLEDGIEIPPKLAGWPDELLLTLTHPNINSSSSPAVGHILPFPTYKTCPWWPPVPSVDGFVTTFDPAGNKIRKPFVEEDYTKPPPIVEIDPNDYTYIPNPQLPDDDHPYFPLSDEFSQGFDVDPIPGIVPMDHLGAEKKQCELVARMAVDEYNRRYDVVKRIIHSLIWKDDKGEIKFGKIIKVMVKAVSGFIYYITAEAISLSSEMPVTFQAVVVTGASEGEVKTFRFISDSNKVPWLWKE